MSTFSQSESEMSLTVLANMGGLDAMTKGQNTKFDEGEDGVISRLF